MFEPNSLVSRTTRWFFAPAAGAQTHQRRLMAAAFSLLVVALIFVLYHDRDFWFPDAQDAEEEILQSGPAVASSSTASSLRERTPRRKTASNKGQLVASAQPVAATPPIVATTTRTVLPPLEVEVVAGDAHRRLRPTSNAIQLDVQPDIQDDNLQSNVQGGAQSEVQPGPFDRDSRSSPRGADAKAGTAFAVNADDSAAGVPDKASERVEMSADTSQMVSESVNPGYPTLARQMKVQGSVILLAMIGRDGLIQELRTLSGPPILSGAAREAVKQWHFKPHFEGSEKVETVARITVNFTISTN